MSVVFVDADFKKRIFVPQGQFQTYGFKGGFILRGEDIPAEFDRTDYVEQYEVFVVGLEDVVCHIGSMVTHFTPVRSQQAAR